jgi:hypothetical protein
MCYGTGFLVGTSTVMTNYHVVEPILKKTAQADSLALRFDFKRLTDGVTLNKGTVYYLEEDWQIASTPYSQADLSATDPAALPGPGELDFALLRVKGKPGNDRVSKAIEPDAPPRGCFDLSTPVPVLEAGDPILIMQHPQGDFLKLAMDFEAVVGYYGDHSRLRYTTSTLAGSSGSPCFNANWKLVALHHAGDPNFSKLGGEYNQGISTAAIWQYLVDHELANMIA